MTTLTLGDFIFARYEIPEQISFGSSQHLVSHTLVGGTKIIDAMGATPVNPSWSGYFLGDAGLDRARYLKNLCDAGKPLALTYSEFSFQALIADFHAEFRSGPYTPYSITLEVIADNTSPITSVPNASAEQLVNDDLDDANALSLGIGDTTLTGLMGTLTSAIADVGSFASAATSVLAGLQSPIGAVRDYVTTLLGANTGILAGVEGIAGILGGGDPLVLASLLTGQLSAAQEAEPLVTLHATLGRMSANVAETGSGTASLAIGGGNLFTIAAQQYGDANAWTAIAQANGLSDPQLSGITTLVIPPEPAVASDGVLRGIIPPYTPASVSAQTLIVIPTPPPILQTLNQDGVTLTDELGEVIVI